MERFASDIHRGECVMCGKCLEVCPLFQATDNEELSPRAKADLLQAMAGGGDLSEAAVRRLAGICLGCQRCRDVCPQNVDVPRQLQALKAAHPGWRNWIWGRLVDNAPRVYPLLAAWGRRAPGLAPSSRRELLRSLGRNRSLPDQVETGKAREGLVQEACVLFPGCAARFAKTGWLGTAEAVLKQAADTVLATPDWACCGFTLGQAGLPEEQHRLQAENVRLWREAGRPRLVVFCATCLAGLQAYGALDDVWQDAAERDAWLTCLTPLWRLIPEPGPVPVPPLAGFKVVAHSPCHSEAGEGQWLAAVLRSQGAEVLSLDQCCGLGGSMQLEHPELCTRVGHAFWDRVPSQIDAVVTGCAGCVVQLGATAPAGIQVGHWLELLTTQ